MGATRECATLFERIDAHELLAQHGGSPTQAWPAYLQLRRTHIKGAIGGGSWEGMSLGERA
eukprot:CAMPEP_0180036472 /NCGR_PEP_ID=MMETSP0984-20121128/30945_1 /TAXON_ID=483367 /ORGANISM="non described non described, Strain CCMP 2436" /LENGTH=60 /DNA_ID=CAMNT_0021962649 /DNA_START=54 /DNA_END=233 /DNA_ORIENTATION=+